jgi:hypothetical protein
MTGPQVTAKSDPPESPRILECAILANSTTHENHDKSGR